jgi:hypothetical protein
LVAGPHSLHPTEHRGLRELYASARHMAAHWAALGRRLGGGSEAATLADGAGTAQRLLEELSDVTACYGVFGSPAAQNVGARIADVRNLLGDRALERNQALRLAVLDAQHLSTLLAYLVAAAEHRGDSGLAAFCTGWERELARCERSIQGVAVASARTPDAAIAPADGSLAGRAAHGVANAAGTAGEWFDRRAAAVRRR